MDKKEGIVVAVEAEPTRAPKAGEFRTPTTSVPIGVSRTLRRRRKQTTASKRMTDPVTAGDNEAFSVQADSSPGCPTPVPTGVSRTLRRRRKQTTASKRMTDPVTALDDEAFSVQADSPPESPTTVLQEAPHSRAWTTEGAIHMPKYFVIAFVEALEKASQHYVLKQYIRDHDLIKHGTPRNLICELVVMKEQKSQFNLIDEKEIQNAVKNHFLELNADRYINLQAITSCKNEKGQGRKNKFSLLVEEDVREDVQDQYLKLKDELATMERDIRWNPYLQVPLFGKVVKKDKFATQDPVYDLVVRTHEEGYVLDDNPEAEIDKIEKSCPVYCHGYFVYQEPPVAVEARTVTVSNISLDATEKDVRASFGLAAIEYVEIERMPHHQIAHITFKYLSGANYAITVTGRRYPWLSMPIRGHGYSRYAPLKVQPREYGEKKAEDENSMHAKALNRYRVLRERLCQSTNQTL